MKATCSKKLWVIVKRGKIALYQVGSRKGSPKIFGQKRSAKAIFTHPERDEYLRPCRVTVEEL